MPKQNQAAKGTALMMVLTVGHEQAEAKINSCNAGVTGVVACCTHDVVGLCISPCHSPLMYVGDNLQNRQAVSLVLQCYKIRSNSSSSYRAQLLSQTLLPQTVVRLLGLCLNSILQGATRQEPAA